jgi:hypothetical protein
MGEDEFQVLDVPYVKEGIPGRGAKKPSRNGAGSLKDEDLAAAMGDFGIEGRQAAAQKGLGFFRRGGNTEDLLSFQPSENPSSRRVSAWSWDPLISEKVLK